MQQFTAIEYIKIDVANHFGLDRETWEDRMDWFDDNEMVMTGMIKDAKEPLLMEKGMRAYEDAMSRTPTGFIMGLDATASGLQIMACLIGCSKTASAVNLVNTGKREDVYENVGDMMSKERSIVKKPVMTTFYGSTQQPKSVFGEDTPELLEFYKTLDNLLPGAMSVMYDIQNCWQGDTLAHTWTLPDGHTAHVKVMNPVDKRIEVDELAHATFTHRAYINSTKDKGLSLAANVIHSIDGYVVREMYRKAQEQGFELLTIHDSFWASPNYIENVRKNYIVILADIADSNLLEDILIQVTGNPLLKYNKYSNSLSLKIMKSDYALS